MSNKRENAEEDYITTPISVLRYISELESQLEEDHITTPISVLRYISELESQLAEAREVQSKLGEWVYQYIHCMRTVDYCGSLEEALEMEQYLYELKEGGE